MISADLASTVLMPALVVATINAVLDATPSFSGRAMMYALGLGAVWFAIESEGRAAEKALTETLTETRWEITQLRAQLQAKTEQAQRASRG
jgi:hypothetical protein